jgi:hypothetical protein
VRDRLDDLFAAYGKGLAALDPGRIVPFYGYPCLMLTDTFVGALSSADELTAALSQANDFYRQFGVNDVRHDIVAVDDVTDRIARVRLRWTFARSGATLLSSEHEYVLRADEKGEPRVHVVVSIDEERKIAALMASGQAAGA